MAEKKAKKNVNEPKSERLNGQKLSIVERTYLLTEIKKRYESGDLNKLGMARDLKISRDTLYSLIKEINLEMDDLPTIKVELKLIYERLRNRAMYLLDKLEEYEQLTGEPQYKEEIIVIREIQNIVNNFYKLLQELGEAPKAPELIGIKGEIDNKIQIEVVYSNKNETSN